MPRYQSGNLWRCRATILLQQALNATPPTAPPTIDPPDHVLKNQVPLGKRVQVSSEAVESCGGKDGGGKSGGCGGVLRLDETVELVAVIEVAVVVELVRVGVVLVSVLVNVFEVLVTVLLVVLVADVLVRVRVELVTVVA